MPFKQTQELLALLRTIHERWRSFAETHQQQGDKRLQVILEHIASERERLRESLEQYERQAPEEVRATWFQYPDEEAIKQPLARMERTDMSVDEAVETALQMSQGLAEMYEHLAHRAPSTAASQLFARLHETETRARSRLVRQLNALAGAEW